MIATTLSKATRVAGATFFATGLLLSTAAQAQISTPAPSPISTVTQRVGLTDITITYSRPSAKGRAVFGSLRPYDVRWRTGANATTKIKFSDDVMVEGKPVAAGEYGIYSVPGKTSWTIVLSKDTKRGADVDGFKDEDNVAKFTVKPYRLTEKRETFTMNFADLTPATANVELEWENTGVKFGIKTDVDTKVMAQINDKVVKNASPSANDMAAAAVYYIDNNKDNKQALAWLQKVNATDPKFWNLHTQAKLQLKMKDTKGALASAEQSKKLAAEAKNDEYVKMNDALIAEAKKAK